METFVYIMCAGGFAKIGVAKNPNRRLATMQTGNPYRIKILALFPFSSRLKAFEYEKHLHEKFKDYRHSGEWFHMGGIDSVMRNMARKQKTTHEKISKQVIQDSFLFAQCGRNYKEKRNEKNSNGRI